VEVDPDLFETRTALQDLRDLLQVKSPLPRSNGAVHYAQVQGLNVDANGSQNMERTVRFTEDDMTILGIEIKDAIVAGERDGVESTVYSSQSEEGWMIRFVEVITYEHQNFSGHVIYSGTGGLSLWSQARERDGTDGGEFGFAMDASRRHDGSRKKDGRSPRDKRGST
jgi:hypothetical protein